MRRIRSVTSDCHFAENRKLLIKQTLLFGRFHKLQGHSLTTGPDANLLIKSHFCSGSAIFFIHLPRTYLRKCFRVPPWKCGSFQSLGDYGIRLARIDYAVMPISMWADTSYQSECGVSVVYQDRFFHNLHGLNETSSTLLSFFITTANGALAT